MLYTITAISPEVEDFVIELQIESDATFADLHTLIRDTCGWGPSEPSVFYICDERWHRDRAIPETGYEYDTMDEVELGDHLEDEGQRMQYLFDRANGRLLLLEVSHISYGKHIDEPCCRRRHGEPPVLVAPASPLAEAADEAPLSTADLLAQLNAAALADDEDIEPTDDDLFDIEEIDLEGFDVTEG